MCWVAPLTQFTRGIHLTEGHDHIYEFDAKIRVDRKYWEIQIPQPTVAKIIALEGNDVLERPVEVSLRFIR